MTKKIEAELNTCAQTIEKVLLALREKSKSIDIYVVGIFDNTHWAPMISKWQDPIQLKKIRLVLNRFDNLLQGIVSQYPKTFFVDDRKWWSMYFGGRSETGKPEYRGYDLAGKLLVENKVGDHPKNLALNDGHGGTLFNALWANQLLTMFNQHSQLNIPLIADEEILSLFNHSSITILT